MYLVAEIQLDLKMKVQVQLSLQIYDKTISSDLHFNVRTFKSNKTK